MTIFRDRRNPDSKLDSARPFATESKSISLSPPQLHRGGETVRVRGDLALNHDPSPRPSPRDGEREKCVASALTRDKSPVRMRGRLERRVEILSTN